MCNRDGYKRLRVGGDKYWNTCVYLVIEYFAVKKKKRKEMKNY